MKVYSGQQTGRMKYQICKVQARATQYIQIILNQNNTDGGNTTERGRNLLLLDFSSVDGPCIQTWNRERGFAVRADSDSAAGGSIVGVDSSDDLAVVAGGEAGLQRGGPDRGSAVQSDESALAAERDLIHGTCSRRVNTNNKQIRWALQIRLE